MFGVVVSNRVTVAGEAVAKGMPDVTWYADDLDRPCRYPMARVTFVL